MRKLNQDEAARAFPRRGQMDLSQYVDALAALQPGDAAAMNLGDLTARAAKRRLGQAANQLGYRLGEDDVRGGHHLEEPVPGLDDSLCCGSTWTPFLRVLPHLGCPPNRVKSTGPSTDPLFADDAIARLHKASLGRPRALNNAATAALIAAATTGKALVDDDCVKKAVAELTP